MASLVCCDCLQFRSSSGRIRGVAALAVVDGALTLQLYETRKAAFCSLAILFASLERPQRRGTLLLGKLRVHQVGPSG